MKQLNRREFLKLGALVAGGAALAACAPAAAPAPAAPAATARTGGRSSSGHRSPEGCGSCGRCSQPEAGDLLLVDLRRRGRSPQRAPATSSRRSTRTLRSSTPPSPAAPSSGGDMKAVLQTRMMGGDPPESFQIHLGGELLDGSYVSADKMEPLDCPLQGRGLRQGLPQGAHRHRLEGGQALLGAGQHPPRQHALVQHEDVEGHRRRAAEDLG